jgi:hypothetical protein
LRVKERWRDGEMERWSESKSEVVGMGEREWGGANKSEGVGHSTLAYMGEQRMKPKGLCDTLSR